MSDYTSPPTPDPPAPIRRLTPGFEVEDDGSPGMFYKADGSLWLRDPLGAEVEIGSGNGGGSSAVISSTDPGAIGAGALWIRTDPSESYAPTVQVRNQADDGWLDEAVVGNLLGLTYYDDAGNAVTSIYGDSHTANMVTPKGTLRLGGAAATLSDPARVDILGGDAKVVVDGADGQLQLRAGANAIVLMDSANEQISLTAGSGIAPFYVTGSDVQANFVVLIGTDVDAPLGADRGAIVIGSSNEISDANLSPGWCGISYDDTNGAAKLKIKAKTADGTVVRGEIALTP